MIQARLPIETPLAAYSKLMETPVERRARRSHVSTHVQLQNRAIGPF